MSNRRQQKRQILTSSSLTHLGEQLAHTGKGLSMKLPYTKSRCWQSWLSGFPFLHMCSLLCYRWPVKSPQIPTTLIKVNITPDWWGIVSWCFLFLMVLLTLLKTLYKENVFGDESEFLVALLIDRRWVSSEKIVFFSLHLSLGDSLLQCISWSTSQVIRVTILGQQYLAL